MKYNKDTHPPNCYACNNPFKEGQEVYNDPDNIDNFEYALCEDCARDIGLSTGGQD